MLFEQILFFLAGAGALAGALGVVLLRNPFYSVLALVGHLVALALLFLLLRAEFLAAAQVVVYAGAVMVLYVFVVAYIGGADEPLRPEGGAVGALGPLFAVALLVELTIAVVGSSLGLLDTTGGGAQGFGSPAAIGPLFAVALLIELTIAVVGSSLELLDTSGAGGRGFGTPAEIGQLLLTDFLIAFEAASFLLLVAAVGAVVLARRRRGLEA